MRNIESENGRKRPAEASSHFWLTLGHEPWSTPRVRPWDWDGNQGCPAERHPGPRFLACLCTCEMVNDWLCSVWTVNHGRLLIRYDNIWYLVSKVINELVITALFSLYHIA